jgi:hypothetical protein
LIEAGKISLRSGIVDWATVQAANLHGNIHAVR